jgi:PKD repeat protein
LCLALLGSLLQSACSKSEPPAPAPARTASPLAAAATPAAPSSPMAKGSPGKVDMNDFSDTADFEWDLAEEAEDAEFEIDAAVTAFYMPQNNIVTFKAKALNGTPPFKFEWKFGDGTTGTGEMIKHQYTALGRLDVRVTGTDATGATSIMTLEVMVDHPVRYAQRTQQEESVVDALRARYGEPPTPGPTP